MESSNIRKQMPVSALFDRKIVGPAIGACCYAVGEEVRNAMTLGYGGTAQAFYEAGRLNLAKANVADLASAGVRVQNISLPKECTSCHTDSYFSHRKERGMTGRFGACIGVRASGRFGDAPAVGDRSGR